MILIVNIEIWDLKNPRENFHYIAGNQGSGIRGWGTETKAFPSLSLTNRKRFIRVDDSHPSSSKIIPNLKSKILDF
ncbi:MAG: hypothetical protein D6742_02470 [Cyanobacteria bacterium J069]|nr:MAG: hypothetical protein D6742_02470 [Cyanobacteria bacterium J069]